MLLILNAKLLIFIDSTKQICQLRIIIKNNLSISLFLLVGIAFAHAQSGITDSGLPNATKGIVRTENLAYHEETTISGSVVGYFTTISNYSGSYNMVQIPVHWSIQDFRVQNGMVYFCGIDNSSGGALLGYFNPAPLISGVGSVQFNYDQNISREFLVLNRMAILRNKTKTALMAIGTALGNDPDRDGAERLIYFDSFPGPGSIFLPESNELFWDVTTVDRYFVSTGTADINSGVVTLRIGDALAGVFASSPSFYQSNSFTLGGNDHFDGGLRSTALKNSDMASMGHFSNNTEQGFYCFVFDASSGQMVNNQRCNYGYTGGISGFPPKELAYLSDSSVLMVAEEPPYITYNGVLKLKPYFNSYWFYETPYYFKCNGYGNPINHINFQSITPQTSNAVFATSGDQWMKLVFDGSLPAWGYVHNCIGSITTDVGIKPILSPQPSVTGSIRDYTPVIESINQTCGSNTLRQCNESYDGRVNDGPSSNDKQ